MDLLIWFGIAFCISQSAMFSGLNLACFSISKLRLEIESKNKNRNAMKVAKLREDSNFLLSTILWGNVGINVLLTLLSNQVMLGIAAFLFSTIIITFLGEIVPQSYFSRHALRMAAMLYPAIRFYQILFYPVAKPTAIFLDKWLGDESISFFREKDLREMLKMHIEDDATEIERFEGKGALNFLAIDELMITEEGEPINPDSIIEMEFENGKPIFPAIERSPADSFLQKVQKSGHKWVILVDEQGEPQMALKSDEFLRSALFREPGFKPSEFCHRPIIVRDPKNLLCDAIMDLKVHPLTSDDDVIHNDVILFWGDEKRVITGSDVLGRLLRGIVQRSQTVHNLKVQ